MITTFWVPFEKEKISVDISTQHVIMSTQVPKQTVDFYNKSLQNVRGDVTEEVKEEMRKVMKKGYKKGGSKMKNKKGKKPFVNPMANKPMAKKGMNNAGFKALPASVQAKIRGNMKEAEKGMSMMKKAYARMGKMFKK